MADAIIAEDEKRDVAPTSDEIKLVTKIYTGVNEMEIRTVGYDRNDIPRVWGMDSSKQMSKFQAMVEAEAYLKRRPDTGPINRWKFRQTQGGLEK